MCRNTLSVADKIALPTGALYSERAEPHRKCARNLPEEPRGGHFVRLLDPLLQRWDNARLETFMTKVTIVTLLIGIVLYFTGQQNTIAILLMIFGGFGLIGAIIWSNKQ